MLILPFDHDYAERQPWFPELLIHIPKRITYSYFLCEKNVLESINISYLLSGELGWNSPQGIPRDNYVKPVLNYFSKQPVYQSTFFRDINQYNGYF